MVAMFSASNFRVSTRSALLVSLTLIVLNQEAVASAGDRDEYYQECVRHCELTGCYRLNDDQASVFCDAACPERNKKEVPLPLRLTSWSCANDCGFHCMTLVSKRRADLNLPTWKYHGKWPFVRVLGIQEICSVVFSLANFFAHWHSIRRVTAQLASSAPDGKASSYPYLDQWKWYSQINMNGWIWSAVFHTRDLEITEALDYMSAVLIVFGSLYCCYGRVLEAHEQPYTALLAVPIGGLFLGHAYYMLMVKFDYGWNMKVCIACGIVQSLTWLVWAMYMKHPARKTILTFVLLIYTAMLLEVLDFPPLGGFLDAHAMWHAATPPLIYLWYSIVPLDAAWLRSHKSD